MQGFVSLRLLAWKVAWNTQIIMIYGTGHSDGVGNKFEGRLDVWNNDKYQMLNIYE